MSMPESADEPEDDFGGEAVFASTGNFAPWDYADTGRDLRTTRDGIQENHNPRRDRPAPGLHPYI